MRVCSHAVGADLSAVSAPPPVGLCGLIGVCSPELLQAYWRDAARPQLDALLRAAALEPPGPRYLLRLDALLAALRNVAAPARHAASCHADEAWREAGVVVAEACAKYEAFIFQTADGELLTKLDQTEQRLAARLRQAEALQREQPQARGAGLQSAAVLSRQLRLCRLLRRSFLRGGAGLLADAYGAEEEDLGHLYAIRTAPSGAQERLTRLLAAEREAVAAVSAAVARGPGRLAVPWAVLADALSTAHIGATGTNNTSTDAGDGANTSAAASTGTKPGGSGSAGGSPSSSPELLVLLEQDPVLGPMTAAATAAGVPVQEAGLPLTPANLRTLLRRHPIRAVRRAAYEFGLVPRVEAAVGALGQVAAVRGQVAALMGFNSFADCSYSRAGLAVADADTVAELLQELAEALLPVAQKEMSQLQSALSAAGTVSSKGAAEAGDASGPESAGTPARPAAATAAAAAAAAVGAGSSGASSGLGATSYDLPPLEPWDVEYAQAELERQRPSSLPDASQLSPYMQLRSVLAGLSDLLHELMGVQLRVEGPEGQQDEGERTGRTAASAGAGAAPEQAQTGRSSGDACGSGAELWGPQVLRLSVWARSTPRNTGEGSGTAVAAAAAQLSIRDGDGGGQQALPAVAVGLKWEWREGAAGSPAALHELLHELGHALHLTLSSSPSSSVPAGAYTQAPEASEASAAASGASDSAADAGPDTGPDTLSRGSVMHFGGLQLPLDALEVPSSLLQTLAYDPAAVARICRRRLSATGGGGLADDAVAADREPCGAADAAAAAGAGAGAGHSSWEPLPPHLAEAVAVHLAAENCGGLGTMGKVLASLFDQLLHSGVLEERGGGRGGAAAAGVALGLWRAVRRAYGALPACDATLRELAALPALAHHQATFHSYLIGLLVASTARSMLFTRDSHSGVHGAASSQCYPTNGESRSSGGVLRPDVFEAGADRDASELVEAWLGLGARSPQGNIELSELLDGDRRRLLGSEALEALARVGRALVSEQG
ncbi:hypothetical protein HYH02_005961 [Chlamydomonas schloesseri]|uniref:Peptidase M3A/M3B catalytic domain-containing protein n=1 Tax=Chlamydomonas schloesseri TaxID=2026947 RepID=A0A836B732_9CHLO|nr:hypothetical protein HYH02_005961 [Chlamydomonas schloesseri]|eukprot:KAG2449214.1 hypothetical protein HYH02_005961 [Chlamydomonas schloesseri]